MSVSNEVGIASAPCGWVRMDLWTGDVKPCYTGTRRFSEEIVVVPKPRPAGAPLPLRPCCRAHPRVPPRVGTAVPRGGAP